MLYRIFAFCRGKYITPLSGSITPRKCARHPFSTLVPPQAFYGSQRSVGCQDKGIILQISERDASGAKLISMPPLATAGDIRGANIVIYVTKSMLLVGYAGGKVVGRRVV